MMYLPEVISSGQQGDRRPRQEQEEMYEDIIANTHPVLKYFDLDIIHSDTALNAKRRLQ
jgi:hypothetical protein